MAASILFALLLSGATDAQIPLADIEKGQPPIKMGTKLDAKGLQQFEIEHQNCPACKGRKLLECTHCRSIEKPKKCPECNLKLVNKKRLAPCYLCAGTGKLANPLETAPCPGCMSHAHFPCHYCANRGEHHWVGSGGSGQKCTTCKGYAAMKCTVCKGSRVVPSAFNGKLEKQSLKKLNAAKDSLLRLMREVESFRLTGKGKLRKDQKRFSGYFKKPKAYFPPLKAIDAHVKKVVKGVNQPNVKDIEKRHRDAFDRMKFYTLNYLVHQKRTLEACISRAEFNQKVAKKAP